MYVWFGGRAELPASSSLMLKQDKLISCPEFQTRQTKLLKHSYSCRSYYSNCNEYENEVPFCTDGHTIWKNKTKQNTTLVYLLRTKLVEIAADFAAQAPDISLMSRYTEATIKYKINLAPEFWLGETPKWLEVFWMINRFLTTPPCRPKGISPLQSYSFQQSPM